MPISSPSWVPTIVPRTATVSPSAAYVLDVEAVVGEDRQDPLPDAPGTAVAVLFGAGGVVDVLRRDEPVDGVEVVPIPDLLDVPHHHGPVLFRWRVRLGAFRIHSWPLVLRLRTTRAA
jgi:hypothetical protein